MSDIDIKSITQTLPNGFSFDLMPVRIGAFMMGSERNGTLSDEWPVHRVEINYDFHMGKYLVTQDLWCAVLNGENPAYFIGEHRPVENVSWYDAVVFCNILNELCGYLPIYYEDIGLRTPFGKINGKYFALDKGEVFRAPTIAGFRLPTEAEWEYAAQFVSQTNAPAHKYSGGNRLDEVGWCEENSHGESKPVGLKLPNELGIYDMSGNLWEWCEDHWHYNYHGAPNNGSSWIDDDYYDLRRSSSRVLRGGGWYDFSQCCRTTYRIDNGPSYRSSSIGFRLVLFSLPA